MSQILGWIIASILAIGAQTGTPLPPPPPVPADVPVATQTAAPVAVPVVEAPAKPSVPKPQTIKPVTAQPAALKPAATKPAAPTETPKPTPPVTTGTPLSNDNYYVNSAGNTVHSPAYSEDGSVPAGASARCRDGTYSFSQHRRGTCSGHKGVGEWL